MYNVDVNIAMTDRKIDAIEYAFTDMHMDSLLDCLDMNLFRHMVYRLQGTAVN